MESVTRYHGFKKRRFDETAQKIIASLAVATACLTPIATMPTAQTATAADGRHERPRPWHALKVWMADLLFCALCTAAELSTSGTYSVLEGAMRLPSSSGDNPTSLIGRLDRIAGHMNAFLVVIAIGLALLDLTCFSVVTVEKAIATGRPGIADSVANGNARNGP
ncbi:MAG TPA: hypothetical protein VGR91_03240 [Stellaceae bacterium]|nr:hypothetical protein [Stellaceae bacterium]